jgi:hypothetical protein
VNTSDEPGRLSRSKLAQVRGELWDRGRRLEELAAAGASEAELEAALTGMRYLHGLIEEHLAAGAPPAKRTARTGKPILELAAA